MKKISFLFLFCSVFLYPQTFHTLAGVENQQGETVLLYRKGPSFYIYNPVYKFNTATLSEQHMISAYDYGFISLAVLDFEFFPADENSFVHTGYEIKPDNHSFIGKNDTPVVWDQGHFELIDISKQDPLKVFAFGGNVLRSFDGGYTYPPDSVYLPAGFWALSVADYDDQVFFGVDEELRFSRNGGVVDTSRVYHDRWFKMLYDPDGLHIYRTNKTYSGYTFNVSPQRGNAFTWSKTYVSENAIYAAHDDSLTGKIYIADQNVIYKSEDYGYTFVPYISLPYKINGLYKKPGTDILYASTPYKIFKVSPDSSVVIKSIPLPQNASDWFPLAVGNRWVYNMTELNWDCWADTTYTESFLIIKDTVMSGHTWYKFEPPLAYLYEYLRIDTTDGRLKTIGSLYLPDSLELTLYDFYMQPGDTVLFSPEYPYGGFVLEREDTVLIFGSYRKIRDLNTIGFLPPSYSLVKGMGFFADGFCEFGGWSRILKGCIINGMVYGDTLSGMEDITGALPDAYALNQNYPNPFNPVTTISYSLPSMEIVVIIVYDALGRKVKTLVNEGKTAGVYTINFDASDLASGIYYYQLRAGEFSAIKKMMLLK